MGTKTTPIEFTDRQIKFLKTILGLDLDAMGFSSADARMAEECVMKLEGRAYEPPEEPTGPGRPVKITRASDLLQRLKQ